MVFNSDAKLQGTYHFIVSLFGEAFCTLYDLSAPRYREMRLTYGVSPKPGYINDTKKAGKRVIAVGTTSCRTLESATGEDGILKAGSGWTEIFIYPGYHFKMIDALITNFHLPESTLVMLVSALAGKENIMHAYEVAVQEKYRFFSFGDAMILI